MELNEQNLERILIRQREEYQRILAEFFEKLRLQLKLAFELPTKTQQLLSEIDEMDRR